VEELLSQLLNVHNVSDVRQLEVHTAEPLVPGPSLEVEVTIAKLGKYKSPGSDAIASELIQAGDKILLYAIHELVNSVWNKEELPDQWKESTVVPIHKRVIKLTVIIIMGKIESNILHSRLNPYIDEIIGDHQCGFQHNRSNTDQTFCIFQILEKNGS
jgi:hypothetical protein